MSEPLLPAYDEVAALVADLWAHPEVGYQETYTSARIRDFLAVYAPVSYTHLTLPTNREV